MNIISYIALETWKMKGYLMKKILPIVRVHNEDVFIQSLCLNAFDRPLLGLGHDIPNLSNSYLGNGCSFIVLPHYNVRLSRNVSLQ